jgi:hypothetical protein
LVSTLGDFCLLLLFRNLENLQHPRQGAQFAAIDGDGVADNVEDDPVDAGRNVRVAG